MQRRDALSDRRRFWQRVDRSGDCWEWQGARQGSDGGGYGVIRLRGVLQLAHRVAYELMRGPIPDGMMVLHACDNPACVRPEHLRVGSHAENMRDRSERGRTASGPRSGAALHPEAASRGERNGASKLTEQNVRQIRYVASRGMPIDEIVGRFHVSRTTIRSIVERSTWKHVE